MSRLIGLLVHFIYWNVFGHFNQLPIDKYHKRQLFLLIQKLMSEIEGKLRAGKIFTMFSMPMVILSIRAIVDFVFLNAYPILFSQARQHSVMNRLK